MTRLNTCSVSDPYSVSLVISECPESEKIWVSHDVYMPFQRLLPTYQSHVNESRMIRKLNGQGAYQVAVLNLFRTPEEKNKHIFSFYVTPSHWHDTGNWNPSSSRTRTYLFYKINIMGADVLATQWARASATMIFTMLNRIKSVSAR